MTSITGAASRAGNTMHRIAATSRAGTASIDIINWLGRSAESQEADEQNR